MKRARPRSTGLRRDFFHSHQGRLEMERPTREGRPKSVGDCFRPLEAYGTTCRKMDLRGHVFDLHRKIVVRCYEHHLAALAPSVLPRLASGLAHFCQVFSRECSLQHCLVSRI